MIMAQFTKELLFCLPIDHVILSLFYERMKIWD
jgi:hypothetical protein